MSGIGRQAGDFDGSVEHLGGGVGVGRVGECVVVGGDGVLGDQVDSFVIISTSCGVGVMFDFWKPPPPHHCWW